MITVKFACGCEVKVDIAFIKTRLEILKINTFFFHIQGRLNNKPKKNHFVAPPQSHSSGVGHLRKKVFSWRSELKSKRLKVFYRQDVSLFPLCIFLGKKINVAILHDTLIAVFDKRAFFISQLECTQRNQITFEITLNHISRTLYRLVMHHKLCIKVLIGSSITDRTIITLM